MIYMKSSLRKCRTEDANQKFQEDHEAAKGDISEKLANYIYANMHANLTVMQSRPSQRRNIRGDIRL